MARAMEGVLCRPHGVAQSVRAADVGLQGEDFGHHPRRVVQRKACAAQNGESSHSCCQPTLLGGLPDEDDVGPGVGKFLVGEIEKGPRLGEFWLPRPFAASCAAAQAVPSGVCRVTRCCGTFLRSEARSPRLSSFGCVECCKGLSVLVLQVHGETIRSRARIVKPRARFLPARRGPPILASWLVPTATRLGHR